MLPLAIVSMESGLEDRNNEVTPMWALPLAIETVSMESGLEDRNNIVPMVKDAAAAMLSQWSPA